MKTDKLLQLIQQKKVMRSGGALPLPKHQAQVSQVGHKLQNNIESYLGYPMTKAEVEGNKVGEKWYNPQTKKWEAEGRDNFRHPMAGRYTSEAITNKFPSWMPGRGILGFIGANALGIGHELIEPNRSKGYSWLDTIREGSEDAFNNMIGAGIGSIPLSDEQKTNVLLYLSDHNLLPDGYANIKGKPTMYLKKQGGSLPKHQARFSQVGKPQPIVTLQRDQPVTRMIKDPIIGFANDPNVVKYNQTLKDPVWSDPYQFLMNWYSNPVTKERLRKQGAPLNPMVEALNQKRFDDAFDWYLDQREKNDKIAESLYPRHYDFNNYVRYKEDLNKIAEHNYEKNRDETSGFHIPADSSITITDSSRDKELNDQTAVHEITHATPLDDFYKNYFKNFKPTKATQKELDYFNSNLDEIYPRIMDLRFQMNRDGILAPGMKVTPDMIEPYYNYSDDDIRNYYTLEELAKIMNEVAYNASAQESNQARQGGSLPIAQNGLPSKWMRTGNTGFVNLKGATLDEKADAERKIKQKEEFVKKQQEEDQKQYGVDAWKTGRTIQELKDEENESLNNYYKTQQRRWELEDGAPFRETGIKLANGKYIPSDTELGFKTPEALAEGFSNPLNWPGLALAGLGAWEVGAPVLGAVNSALSVPLSTVATVGNSAAMPWLTGNSLLGAYGASLIPGNLERGEYGWAALNSLPVTAPLLETGFKRARNLFNTGKNFKSEINWGKWNSEIPSNKALMDEYHAIEETSKANGTWMKNADGSAFQGTPEQFVQQSSENFKKAFPGGFATAYRGQIKPTEIIGGGDRASTEGISFLGDKDQAMSYAQTWKYPKHSGEIYQPGVSNSEAPSLYELIYPKSSNTKIITHPEPRSWQKLTDDEVASQLDQLTLDMRGKSYKGEQFISTDDVADFVSKNNLDYAYIPNIMDYYSEPSRRFFNLLPGKNVGNTIIMNSKPGKYLKSNWYNNGMFDMTNPNIYKGLVPAGIFGAGVYGTQGIQQQRNGGSLDKYQWKYGQVSPRDSVQNIAYNTMTWEKNRGHKSGYGLSDFGNPKLPTGATINDAVNWYMNNTYTNPIILEFPTAKEKGSAGDFIYNTGRDPRIYMLDQYLKSIGQTGLPGRGDFNIDMNQNPNDWAKKKPELDALWNKYKSQIYKLSENDRRILLNKGRDFYYQNINTNADGTPNDAYWNTWYGRQHATDQYVPFTDADVTNTSNKKFYPIKKQVGGSLPQAQFGGFPLGGLSSVLMSYLMNNTSNTQQQTTPDQTNIDTSEELSPYETLNRAYSNSNKEFDKSFNSLNIWPKLSGQTINLTNDRYRGAKVPIEYLNMLTDSAKRFNLDPYTLFALAGRESTFGQDPRYKRRNVDPIHLVSGWNLAERYQPYELARYLADQRVPGISTTKDYHGYYYNIEDLNKVNEYLTKHPEINKGYLKKLQSTPKFTYKNPFDLAAEFIVKKGLDHYNPGDRKYRDKINNEIALLKKEAALTNFLANYGKKEEGGSLPKAQNGRNFSKQEFLHSKDKEVNDARTWMMNWTNSPIHRKLLEASIDKDDPIGLNSWYVDQALDSRKNFIQGVNISPMAAWEMESRKNGNSPSSSSGKNRAIAFSNTSPTENFPKGFLGMPSFYASDPAMYSYIFAIKPSKDTIIRWKYGAFPDSDTLSSTIGHEISHASDVDGEGIPQSDVDYMKRLYDSSTKNRGTDFQKYVGEATETRARLNQIRMQMQKEGIYDPFNQLAPKDALKKYKGISKGFDALDQLRDVYDDDQIINMLNTISRNESSEESNQAQSGGLLPKAQTGIPYDKIAQTAVKYSNPRKFIDIQPVYHQNIVIDNYSPKVNYLLQGDKLYMAPKGTDAWLDISDNNFAKKGVYNFLNETGQLKNYSQEERDIYNLLQNNQYDYFGRFNAKPAAPATAVVAPIAPADTTSVFGNTPWGTTGKVSNPVISKVIDPNNYGTTPLVKAAPTKTVVPVKKESMKDLILKELTSANDYAAKLYDDFSDALQDKVMGVASNIDSNIDAVKNSRLVKELRAIPGYIERGLMKDDIPIIGDISFSGDVTKTEAVKSKPTDLKFTTAATIDPKSSYPKRKNYEIEPLYQELATTSDNYLSYINVFDNNKGFDYIPTARLENAGKYSNVEGMAHFLFDYDMTTGQSADNSNTLFMHNNAKYINPKSIGSNEPLPSIPMRDLQEGKALVRKLLTYSDKELDPKSLKDVKADNPGSTVVDPYYTIWKSNPNGTVNVKYKKADEITKGDKLGDSLRQYRFTDINWDSQTQARSFKSSIGALRVKNSDVPSYFIYPKAKERGQKDAYGKFGGNSVIFLIEDTNVAIDFSGSINQIKDQGLRIIQQFGIKPEQLIVAYHDVGSYSAKPQDINGVIDSDRYYDFNTNKQTGAGLAIPKIRK